MDLIDRDVLKYNYTKLLTELTKKYGLEEAKKGLHFSWLDVIANLNSEPVVDAVPAVPVVRCKECKWYDNRLHECANFTEYETNPWCTDPDWYCADGERRTDDNNRIDSAIVRCADCKYWHVIDLIPYCDYWHIRPKYDGFCSEGKTND